LQISEASAIPNSLGLQFHSSGTKVDAVELENLNACILVGVYLSGKSYVRYDKMRLDRFMELANITSSNLDDHDIVFPELYEIYS
jgi:hypothetical protein